MWDGFRWKPDALLGVGTCLGLILDETSLKMSKNCFCICSCMCRLGPAYTTCIHAYTTLFLRTQVCSWVSACVRMDLHMLGLTCMRGLWLVYMWRLIEALLYPILLNFLTISLPHAILMHILALFAPDDHCIILLIFILALKHHISWISLKSWI